MSEVRCRMTEGRRQRTEGRRQRTEGRRQRTEGGGRGKSDVRCQRTEDGGKIRLRGMKFKPGERVVSNGPHAECMCAPVPQTGRY